MLASLLTHPFLMPIGLLLAGMTAIAKAPNQPGAKANANANAATEPTYPPVADLVEFEMLPSRVVVQRFKRPVASALLQALANSNLATDEGGNAFSPKPGVLVYRLIPAAPGMPLATESALEAQAQGFLVLAGTSMVDVAKGGGADHFLVFCEPGERALASNAGELAILLEPVAQPPVITTPEVIVTPAPAVATPSEAPKASEGVVDVEAPTEPPPPVAETVKADAAPRGAKKAAKKPAKSGVRKTAAPKKKPAASEKKIAASKLNGAASPPAFQTPTLSVEDAPSA